MSLHIDINNPGATYYKKSQALHTKLKILLLML